MGDNTKKTLTGFLDGVSNEDLAEIIKEFSDFDKTGVLCNGLVRSFCGVLTRDYLVPREHAISILEKYFHRIAAEKWAKSVSYPPLTSKTVV
jgi:hypothetical protein